MFHNAENGATYNIGGDNEWSNIELIKHLITITDRELGRSEGESLELITHIEDRAGHDLRYAIDSSRLQSELGWSAETSFEDGLLRTVRWYLKNMGKK